MTRQHHASFVHSIFGSTQRLFRSRKPHGLLASNHINEHTMRDIGINPLNLR